MKNITIHLSSLLLLFTLSLSCQAQEISGHDIMVKVDNRPDGDTRYNEMVLKLINRNNRTRKRKVKVYAKDYGKDTKQILFFLYPGDVKGTGFLTWEYDKIDKDDDKWLYLPALKKTRRISGSSAKKDYFMGTDFTYDDMGDRNVNEDKHTLIREELYHQHKCWVVESKPLTKGEIYSKKISWIRQDCLMAEKVEFYDKLNKLHRILTLSDIKQIQGIWTMGKMEMKNVQTKHRTKIVLMKQKFDIPINPRKLTVSSLEKGL